MILHFIYYLTGPIVGLLLMTVLVGFNMHEIRNMFMTKISLFNNTQIMMSTMSSVCIFDIYYGLWTGNSEFEFKLFLEIFLILISRSIIIAIKYGYHSTEHAYLFSNITMPHDFQMKTLILTVLENKDEHLYERISQCLYI